MIDGVAETMRSTVLRSPLRYPGGKSRAVEQIFRRIPESFAEFREPFVGGGTVFLTVRRRYPSARVWINDLNADLACFWTCAQADMHRLAKEIRRVKRTCRNGRRLFERLRSEDTGRLSEFDRAVRFFVLNRIGFSGTVDAGGYSEAAFRARFTDSSIDRLLQLERALEGVRITNLDYKDVVRAGGEDVFVFLDPPYLAATRSKLYGRDGALHLAFDHDEFAREMRGCPHRWLITYDDSPQIRRNFAFAHIDEWQLQYGMNNFKQGQAAKGRELFIDNYRAEARPD